MTDQSINQETEMSVTFFQSNRRGHGSLGAWNTRNDRG